MNHILRKIGAYQGTFQYKENILSINFTHSFKNQIFFINLTDEQMPPKLKEIADNPKQLFQIISDLGDDKIIINEAEELVLLIGIGKKIKEYVINLQKADISKQENLNKKVYQLEKQLQQKQFELKFYKEQYLLLLNNLQLKPKVQEVSKLYHINVQDIFINNNGQPKAVKSFSSVVYQQKPNIGEKRLYQSQIKFENINVNRNEMGYLCPKMHALNKYNSKDLNNSHHLCNICRVRMQNDAILYRCVQCDFDVCDKCMTMPPQNRKYCPKLHALRFGAASNYIIRRCDKCMTNLGLEKGYTCLNCDYDMCKQCYEKN